RHAAPRVRARGARGLVLLLLRRRARRGGGPRFDAGPAVSRPERTRRALAALPRADRRGEPGRGRPHQRVGGPGRLRRPRLPEAGAMDGRAAAAPESTGAARRRRRVRLPHGSCAPGAALDDGPGPGMALPPAGGAAPAVAALPRLQPAVRLVRDAPVARVAPGRAEPRHAVAD